MWPFKRKPTNSWEEEYATNIYNVMIAEDDIGDITARLQIPTALHQVYQNKILLQRELICFSAFASIAEEVGLQSVFHTFTDLLLEKLKARGLQINRKQLADHAITDTEEMLAEPIPWGQRWLAEFRNDPNDELGAFIFVGHCRRLFHAYKRGIGNTRPK